MDPHFLDDAVYLVIGCLIITALAAGTVGWVIAKIFAPVCNVIL